MEQRHVMSLLKEAASPGCHYHRRNQIQCKLSEAASEKDRTGAGFDEGKKEGIKLVLDKLYADTLEHNPELLPSLFPVFAIICGDRKKGMLCANVDWTLLNPTR